MSEPTPMVHLAEEYLDYRRRLGFQLRIEGPDAPGVRPLRRSRRAIRGPLTTELAVRWARLPAGASPLYQARRLEVVRCFARHRAIFDPATEVPPEGLLGSAHRRTIPTSTRRPSCPPCWPRPGDSRRRPACGPRPTRR